jgi:hypothetical protein
MNNKIFIIILVIIIIALLIFIFIKNEGYNWGSVKGDYNNLGPNPIWKIDYLKKVYPLGSNLSEKQFDKLEAYYTFLLPENVKCRYNVFTAKIAGPSCEELPCDCGDNNTPQVQFDPDPMLKKQWPPCDVRNNPECCASVDKYKQCYSKGLINWASDDTWDGVIANALQSPPTMGQLWKPSLWNNYTLAVNMYDPKNWNSFYKSGGDKDNTWVEIFHSSFSVTTITYGVWFYRTIGSGIFVNLGKTITGLNKIHMVNLLGMSWLELAKFILRENRGDVFTDKIPINQTGLGGKLNYWLNGQYSVNTDMLFENIPKTAENLAKILEQACFGDNYNLNRIANTGSLDNLIIFLANNRYNSIQFTVQPNVYTGFTSELVILGTNKVPYTSIEEMPKSQLRILDPNNLPNGTPSTNLGKPCNFKFPFACIYCEDISSFTPCKTPAPPPYHDFGFL